MSKGDNSVLDALFHEWRELFKDIRQRVTEKALGGGDSGFNEYRQKSCRRAGRLIHENKPAIITHYDEFILRYENEAFGSDSGGYVWHWFVTNINQELTSLYEDVLRGGEYTSKRLPEDAYVWFAYTLLMSEVSSWIDTISKNTHSDVSRLLMICEQCYKRASPSIHVVIEKTIGVLLGIKYGAITKKRCVRVLQDPLFNRKMLYDVEKNDLRCRLFA